MRPVPGELSCLVSRRNLRAARDARTRPPPINLRFCARASSRLLPAGEARSAALSSLVQLLSPRSAGGNFRKPSAAELPPATLVVLTAWVERKGRSVDIPKPNFEFRRRGELPCVARGGRRNGFLVRRKLEKLDIHGILATESRRGEGGEISPASSSLINVFRDTDTCAFGYAVPFFIETKWQKISYKNEVLECECVKKCFTSKINFLSMRKNQPASQSVKLCAKRIQLHFFDQCKVDETR